MTADSEGLGLQTQLLHGADALDETHAVTSPIWQTSTFAADSPEHLAVLGETVHPSEFYTRYGNPMHAQVAA
ncbi:MAG: PLP-dependent transferase, partial [Acidobacteria bacterium]|nr:PLP-dependent transferase [Acidobacteriota bacterium]